MLQIMEPTTQVGSLRFQPDIGTLVVVFSVLGKMPSFGVLLRTEITTLVTATWLAAIVLLAGTSTISQLVAPSVALEIDYFSI
jgi:hypothetical protein